MNFVRPPEFRLTKASLHRQAENLLHKRKGRPTHPLVEGVPARKAWMTCDDLCCVKYVPYFLNSGVTPTKFVQGISWVRGSPK